MAKTSTQTVSGRAKAPSPQERREAIAEQLAAVMDDAPVYADGVMPLNPGVLHLQAIRANAATTKARDAQRPAIRSK